MKKIITGIFLASRKWTLKKLPRSFHKPFFFLEKRDIYQTVKKNKKQKTKKTKNEKKIDKRKKATHHQLDFV